MHPATLHGVGVLTKLHFAIFAAMTLNLAQRSFKVIDFSTNQKRVYVFLLVVNSNVDPLAPFQRYGGLNVKNRQFSLPHSYSGQNLGCSLWSRSVMLVSAESEISHEIIFAEFQPI